VNFLFDANCNPRLIDVVRNVVAGHVFEDLRVTHPHADEPVWMPEVASRPEPWVVISGDKARFRKPAELIVLKRYPMTWVGLMGTYIHAGFDEQARRLAEAWPSLVRKIEGQKEHWVYKIKQDPLHRNPQRQRRVIVERYRRIAEL